MRSDRTWTAWLRYTKARNPSVFVRRQAEMVLDLKSTCPRKAHEKVRRAASSGRWPVILTRAYHAAIDAMRAGYDASYYGDCGEV